MQHRYSFLSLFLAFTLLAGHSLQAKLLVSERNQARANCPVRLCATVLGQTCPSNKPCIEQECKKFLDTKLQNCQTLLLKKRKVACINKAHHEHNECVGN